MKQTAEPAATTLLNTTVIGQPWHGDYRLGLGVDAVTGQLRARAVEPFEVQNEPQMSPTYVYSLIESESDVSSLVAGSVEGSYNMEGVTVGASTSFLDSLAVSELSVTLIAQMTINRSQYSLAPHDGYKLAVEPGHDFREKYGDYFVAGYRSASVLYVLYQCHFRTAEDRRQFSLKFSAEVPQVFTAKGSTEFESAAKSCNATISIRITAHGVDSGIPTPPSEEGWTAGNILNILLPWFDKSRSLQPLEAYLMHYRVIDPALSGEVPVSPLIFSKLAYLYDRFWLTRARWDTVPDFGRPLVEQRYKMLEKTIEAQQAALPDNPEEIEKLTAQTTELLGLFTAILNRQTFFSQVQAAVRTEPERNLRIDADKGTVRWCYGYDGSNLPGVTIASRGDHVAEDWKIGYREHTFNFRDTTKLIVGWDVVCNWTDGTGGDWEKRCDHIIGQNAGEIWVKSDYDRGYSWSIAWHYVDAIDYPTAIS
ncbi:hypothetical protein [Nocardioides sp. WS12]|uniref:hypothetical protein n=1 Tax=Nocardioides sp. WS12 TaxID=2486272 RepID=UPI0015F8F15F|nr:hypothetical protein [Nocardioides sp. WS12]